MQGASLADLLRSIEVGLASTTNRGSFRVGIVPGTARHYVGRNDAGQLCVLLGSGGGPMHAPVKLAAIEVRFGATCRIEPIGGDPHDEILTVISCTSSDPQAQAYFLHVCETIIRILGPSPSLPMVVDVVQRLVELFRRLAKPASRSIVGLLGELYLVARSRNIVTSVSAWRSTDVDRFDFSIGDVRLDVKASSERARVHHLSAEQCQPPVGTVGLLASIFIESSGGGTSLRELLTQIERRLIGEDKLILKVQAVVAETLGETLPASLSMCFDDRLAQASLQVYDIRSVPAIREGIPIGVSRVHFTSDLSQTLPLTMSEIGDLATIGLALLPDWLV